MRKRWHTWIYLTSNTTCNQFLFITYTIKMGRANPWKRIYPYEKNDTPKSLGRWYLHFYSRYYLIKFITWFKFITANIIAQVIVDILPDIYLRMDQNTTTILSGIIKDRLDDIKRALKENSEFISYSLPVTHLEINSCSLHIP